MPVGAFFRSLSSSKIDFVMGNPFLSRTVDGFLKIGAIGASKVAAEETYHYINKGGISKVNFEESLRKMCIEGAYWGTAAGVYVGVDYGMERIRGTRDWKNAMLGGAMTGALISAASNNSRDKVIAHAITAAAVATAVEIINNLT